MNITVREYSEVWKFEKRNIRDFDVSWPSVLIQSFRLTRPVFVHRVETTACYSAHHSRLIRAPSLIAGEFFRAPQLPLVVVITNIKPTSKQTTQHDTTQHDTTQHDTTQHDTTQHYTTQHNTTRHNTKHTANSANSHMFRLKGNM